MGAPSKDHGMLYYTRIDKPGLFRMPIDGGDEALILEDLQFDDWGNWITTEAGVYVLQRMPSRLSFYDYATGDITELGRLRSVPAGMVGITLSPDQKNLAYVQQHHNNADLWMVDGFE